MSVVIETTLGDIIVDLYLSERPRACLNFLKLCKLKYYNFNLFHTISRGFIAQTGDPTGSRTGGESIFGVIDGPSKRFFEAENEPRIKHTRPGLISFVGGEDNMIGSQFFLTLGEDLTYLDEKHCVFGEVVEGVEILEAINEVICDKDDRPYQDVRITHTVVLADPCPDPKNLRVPSRSPSPSAERLAGGRIAPDEEVDETSGRSVQEIAEMQAEREAKARATILEMVGDIPDAEMAPPENVLFVCKLNPVTTDDDLEIIFSRFGKIKSCEVIRDRKTGDSLQYAFIEFEEQKSCEDAYFKMGNVLIDDRRIHVDFSQSVSKVKWMGKGRGVTHYDEKGNKSANVNKDVGKGNYKAKNGIKEEDNNRRRDRKQSNSPRRGNKSPVRDRKSNSSPRRYRESSRSPKRERKSTRSPQRRSGYSDRYSQNKYSSEYRRRRSPSPIKFKRKSSSPAYKRKRSRSLEDSPRRNNKRSSYRRRSRSHGRSSNRNYESPSHTKKKSPVRRRSRSPKRAENSRKSYGRKSVSPRRTKRDLSREKSNSVEKDRSRSPKRTEKPRENPKRTQRESRSPNEKSVVQQHSVSLERLFTKSKSPIVIPSSPSRYSVSPSLKKRDKHVSSKMSDKADNEKTVDSESIGGNNKEALKVRNEKTGKSKIKLTKVSKTKKKKRKSSNSSDESETESEDDRPKKKKYKKKAESSTESSSSSDESSSSSEEEKVKGKSKKRKNKKKNIKVKKSNKSKRKKKKYSSSSESSSSESSSSESSSGSITSSNSSNASDSSSDKGKQKKSKRKRTKSTSESD